MIPSVRSYKKAYSKRMTKNGASRYSPQNRKGQDRPLVWSRDMPLKEHEYERFREPDFWLEVWIFSLLMALMAGALVLGAAKLRGSEEPWAWAFAGSGLFGGLVALWRIRTLDDTEVLRREYELYQDVQFQQRAVIRNGEPMTLTRQPKPVEWRGKHFAFQGWQLDRLLSWYQDGQDRRIRRDKSGVGRGWSEIGIGSDAYSGVVEILEGLGYVAGPTNAKAWTDDGIAWLEAE